MRSMFVTAAFVSLAAALPAFADNSGSGTVTVGGQVVAALTITAEDDLRFGELVRPSSGEASTTVQIAATSGAGPTYTNGGDPGDSNRTAAANIGPGRLTVTGEPNFSFGVGFQTPVFPNGVIVNIVSPAGGQTLDVNGNFELFIGGTMTASTTAAVQTISGNVDVTVQYN